jgi:Flp pilus assembly protein TadG
MRGKKRIVQKSERGQSFLELGVSLIFLLILLAAVVDLGWAFYTMTALRDTAQEAASFGTMCPDKDLIKQRLRLSTSAPLSMQDVDNGNISITFLDVTDGTELTEGKHGDLVHVSVEIQHKIVTPFVGSFIGRWEYPLMAEVSDTIMVDTCQANLNP